VLTPFENLRDTSTLDFDIAVSALSVPPIGENYLKIRRKREGRKPLKNAMLILGLG